MLDPTGMSGEHADTTRYSYLQCEFDVTDSLMVESIQPSVQRRSLLPLSPTTDTYQREEQHAMDIQILFIFMYNLALEEFRREAALSPDKSSQSEVFWQLSPCR